MASAENEREHAPGALRFAAAERLVAGGLIPSPSSWLRANADLLPPGGAAIDIACGSGRHALFLAAAGFRVRAVDRAAAGVAALGEAAARLGLHVEAEVLDLEAGEVSLGENFYDLVLVVHYLHRPLFPVLERALKPGGLLLYETFTVDQAARGRPTNPAFLLEHGELRRLVAPLRVLRERDGEHEGRHVAGVAARKQEDEVINRGHGAVWPSV